ncbi:MAG: hypothetical protein EBX37_04115 [Alphaproteobacteria bacterium]|jgi:hypothetical protein|nr:hypothetical protein [Alphaproteobacteria bacterium]
MPENEEIAPAEAQQDLGKARDARAEATDEPSMDDLQAVAGGVTSRMTPKPTKGDTNRGKFIGSETL